MAKKYLNVPYLWGGRTTIGIDCSGYTQMVFRFFNKQLPRDAYQQASVGEEIYDLKDVKLGDLAFFTSNKTITHVGIILRKNKINNLRVLSKEHFLSIMPRQCRKSRKCRHIGSAIFIYLNFICKNQ